MKAYSILSILLISLLCSCSGGAASGNGEYDTVLYQPEYASGFIIYGSEGRESSIITVVNPWQGADSVATRLFVSRNGEKAPSGFDGQILDGDARRIVTMSSTHIAMLDAVGAADRVVGVSGIDYIINPAIQSHRDSIGDVGYEGNIDYERLLSLDPDIVLLYGINGASSMEDKLEELGIPYMYVGDYLEENPLGKAEWMVALGELTGCRAESERVYAEIPVRYNSLAKRVADATLEAPRVMLNTPYAGSWFMPPADSYVSRLISDAGGRSIFQKDNGNASVAIDLEEAYRLVSEADVWLNVGMTRSLAELKSLYPKFADTPCVKAGEVYNNNLRSNSIGGNDYYETAVVRPDVLLRDLVKIFHPSLVTEDFAYYQRLE